MNRDLLLGLPVEHAMLPSLPRLADAREQLGGRAQMWGMPATWATWSEGDTGYRVTDASKAKVGSSYPNAQPRSPSA